MAKRKKKKIVDISVPLQHPANAPESDWIAPRLCDLPSWKGAKRVALDTETYDPFLKELGPSVRHGGFVCGYSFALEDGPSFYVPVRHQLGGNVEEGEKNAFAYLRDQLKTFSGDIVGANLSYDIDYLANEDICFQKARFRDIQIAAPLINELERSYSLQAIAERLGLQGKDEELLQEAAEVYGVDAKADMWRLPAKYIGQYAERDATLPLHIIVKQEQEIARQGLQDIYDLESKVLPVLVKMRRRGVKIDTEKLAYIERWSLEQEAEALEKVFKMTGHRIEIGDIWKPSQVIPAVQEMGAELPETKTGKLSIRAEVLEDCSHPGIQHIVWARKVNKLRTTFANSIRKHLTDGSRIHPNFNQMAHEPKGGGIRGARYGRLSMSNPNMQQQPSRDSFAKLWRSIYLPEDGKIWCSGDYSQQEPRILLHYALLSHCPGAEAAVQKYINDPDVDCHAMMAELSGLPRKEAKSIFLGKCYGMGGAKMCHKLGLPTTFFKNRQGRKIEIAGEEGQRIIKEFDERVPYVATLARKCEAVAKRKGYITTLGDRKCHFPMSRTRNEYDWTYKALNRLIQGSAADQTKQAMVEADAAGLYLQLQVHDELIASVENQKEATMLSDIMRNCMKIEVPMKVDIETGPNWGDSK